MRSLAFIFPFIALVLASTARGGLTSTSYAQCVCNDVELTVRKNNAAIEAVNRKIARATSQNSINRYLRELQSISQQSERNLAAAYASCQKKEALCKAEQNAAAGTPGTPAVSSRPDVQTERNIDVIDDDAGDEAIAEAGTFAPTPPSLARPAAPGARVSGSKGGAGSVTIINSSSKSSKPKSFAEVDVLPAFRESFANDPLVSPGAGKDKPVDPQFSLDQIAVHEGYVARGGRGPSRGGSGANEEVQFRIYGPADRRALMGGSAPGKAGKHVAGVSARNGIATVPVPRVPAAAATTAPPEETRAPRWVSYLPKFLAETSFIKSFFKPISPKRAVASERSQIAGMHTDIFYNVNRAYMMAGDTLKR